MQMAIFDEKYQFRPEMSFLVSLPIVSPLIDGNRGACSLVLIIMYMTDGNPIRFHAQMITSLFSE